MTTTTATRDPFAGLTAYADESDAMAESFGIVTATPVTAKPAPAVRCLGCGRVLRSAESIARSRGRSCYRRALAAAATLGPEYSDRQVEAAVEAIEDGAVVPAAVSGVWYVVGSRGDAIYETTAVTCTCKHFTERGKACSHMAAVELVAA